MNEWRPVGRPATRAQVDGDIPDVHVIAVRERRVTVDYPTIIQNNVNTDTIELDLDGEWDGMSVVLVLGPCGGATELAWHGEPLTLPSALAEDTGGIDVSVVGYSADGETRLVTVAAPSLLNVIKSGCTVGEAPGDETPDLIGQLVAAGDAANKAAQSANAAATSANKAAGAANTAASAANTAAGKANTAATKATDAATKATDAAGEATRAAQSANAAAEAASAAAEAARGNVLKGTLGPATVLSADDAYATKPRRLTVHGATRQNLWVNPSGTNNGVTVTSNDDGSITVSGTSTSHNVWIGYKRRYNLSPGSTYTLSVDDTLPSGTAFKVEPRDADGVEITGLSLEVTSNKKTTTATLPSNTAYINFLFYSVAPVGTTLSGTYRVMLNEGSTAQPWCPPGLNSVGELSVVTAGKNYFPRLSGGVFKGITVTANSDGSYTLNGTSSAADAGAIALNVNGIPKGHELTLSYYGYDSTAVKVQVYFKNIDGAVTYIDVYKTPKTFTIPEGATQISARVVVESANTTVNNVTVYPQLELGSTATDYEPPAVTTTPIDLDGHTLNSLPDGTCDELRIDGTGAVTLVQRVGDVTFDGSEDEGWGYQTYKLGMNNGAPGLESQLNDINGRCDTLPIIGSLPSPSISAYAGGWVDIRIDDVITDAESGKSWLAANHTTLLYPLYDPQTIPLTAVTLPTLPSPNITVYTDSDVPSDITLEYERDVTIAFGKLQAQVSATTVREATNG